MFAQDLKGCAFGTGRSVCCCGILLHRTIAWTEVGFCCSCPLFFNFMCVCVCVCLCVFVSVCVRGGVGGCPKNTAGTGYGNTQLRCCAIRGVNTQSPHLHQEKEELTAEQDRLIQLIGRTITLAGHSRAYRRKEGRKEGRRRRRSQFLEFTC